MVQFAVPRRGLPSAASFRRWAAAVSSLKVNLVVVGRAEGRRLNDKFRRRNKPTNVLSFRDTGDVVLCAPVIRKEAREQGKTLAAHYAHLVVHGILHLRGYDHVTKRQAARMEREEIRRLARLGFADPYTVE
ncbi:MAG TPA: rRNA maturation RNase YbeY [Burkholderiales bacterium]|nr:rRNA maturation RNase YbeY [Burkholderiales bacterium]